MTRLIVDTAARSPFAGPVPVERDGWLVGTEATSGPLRLSDLTPVTAMVVHAEPAGEFAERFGVTVGRAELFEDGILITSVAPGRWFVLATSSPDAVADQLSAPLEDEVVTIVDVTHGHAKLRVTGELAARLLSRLVSVELSDRIVPYGAVLRTLVAGVATTIVRDDLFATELGGLETDPDVPSYLLVCDLSEGHALRDALLRAGRDLAIAPEGYAAFRSYHTEV
ncbi:MAG: hypothetical protein S0880_05130 [Actinomycetota bacterium]|nr:hypothetical protein [Actinomycetota bacterium]